MYIQFSVIGWLWKKMVLFSFKGIPLVGEEWLSLLTLLKQVYKGNFIP